MSVRSLIEFWSSRQRDALPPPPPPWNPPPAPKLRCRDLVSTATTSTSAPAAVITDAVFEILSWLPAKSLCRCGCVSKAWRDLISDPTFVAVRRSRAEPLLVAKTDHTVHPRSLQLMDTEGTVVGAVSLPAGTWTFRASVDGLACVTRAFFSSDPVVVDLATGVPLMNCFTPDWAYYICVGFGRTATAMSGGVYKVLCLCTYTRTCKVLTVGDGAEWRPTRPCPMEVCLHYDSRSGVTVDGASHFLSRDEVHVLRFDLEREEWKVIHGPQTADGRLNSRSIAELNGSLCMAHIIQPAVIDIWRLLSDDSDMNIWSPAYTIRMDRKVVVNYVVPLRVLRLGGGLLFYYHGNGSNPVLQVYHPRSGRCTHVNTPANIVGKIGLCSNNLDPR